MFFRGLAFVFQALLYFLKHLVVLEAMSANTRSSNHARGKNTRAVLRTAVARLAPCGVRPYSVECSARHATGDRTRAVVRTAVARFASCGVRPSSLQHSATRPKSRIFAPCYERPGALAAYAVRSSGNKYSPNHAKSNNTRAILCTASRW